MVRSLQPTSGKNNEILSVGPTLNRMGGIGSFCSILFFISTAVTLRPFYYGKWHNFKGVRKKDCTGRPMKGMAFVDPKSCADAESMVTWLEQILNFAHSLPAK